MTSSRFTFIQVSAPTSLPLYVSPFFSSINMAWPVAVDRRLSAHVSAFAVWAFYARWLAASASDRGNLGTSIGTRLRVTSFRVPRPKTRSMLVPYITLARFLRRRLSL